MIGAGHGGLACAARLAVKGHDVTVIERTATAVTIPALLTLPAAYRDLFIKTGSELETVIELNEIPSAMDLKLSTGVTVAIPASGVGRVCNALENHLGKEAANQWREYLNALSEIWLAIRKPLVETEPKNNLKLVQHLGISSLWKMKSTKRLIHKHLKHPDLIRLATAYRNYAHVDADCDLGFLGISAYVQEVFGVYEPVGGFSALTNQLQIRCAQIGVKFKFETVASPISDGDVLFGVELRDRTLIAADYVIVNDFTAEPEIVSIWNLPTVFTSVAGLYRLNEKSWLGLGPAHVVMSAEIVAEHIGRAATT